MWSAYGLLPQILLSPFLNTLTQMATLILAKPKHEIDIIKLIHNMHPNIFQI